MADATASFTTLTTALIADVDPVVVTRRTSDLTLNSEVFFTEPDDLAALTDAQAAATVDGMTQEDVYEMRKGIPTHRTRKFAERFAATHGIDANLFNSRIARAEAAIFSGRGKRGEATDSHRRGDVHVYGNQISPTDSFGRPKGMSLRGPRDTDLTERNVSRDPVATGNPYRQAVVASGSGTGSSSSGLDLTGLDLNYAYITYITLDSVAGGSLYISTSGSDASETNYDYLLYFQLAVSSLSGPYTGMRIDEFEPGGGMDLEDVSRFLLVGMVNPGPSLTADSYLSYGLSMNTRAHPSTIRVYSPDSANYRYWFARSSDIQYSYRR